MEWRWSMRMHVFGTIIMAAALDGSIARAVEDVPPGLKAMVRDIQLLNLINGLELSDGQRSAIAGRAREAEAARRGIEGERAAVEREYASILTELRGVLVEGRTAPEELKKRLHRAREARSRLEERLDAKLKSLSGEVEKVLEGHQTYAVTRYKPCLIPPQTGAIGQASEPDAVVKRLDKLRSMDGRTYKRMRIPMAYEALGRIRASLPPGTDLDEEKETTFILGLFEKVRSSSDADYLVKKVEFASELAGRYMPDRPSLTLAAKIAQLLLDPAVIPLLDKSRVQ
jgi:hypothetical protein